MSMTKDSEQFSEWLEERENTFYSCDPLTPDELYEKYTEEFNSKDSEEHV